MKQLLTTDEIAEALDGPAEISRLTGKPIAQISNAKKRGWWPRDTYPIMKAALELKGYTAPAHLWKMRELPPELRTGVAA